MSMLRRLSTMYPARVLASSNVNSTDFPLDATIHFPLLTMIDEGVSVTTSTALSPLSANASMMAYFVFALAALGNTCLNSTVSIVYTSVIR